MDMALEVIRNIREREYKSISMKIEGGDSMSTSMREEETLFEEMKTLY